MTIQDRLKTMKQRDAAAAIGVSRPYIAQMIRGIRVPSLRVVAGAADALGCDDAEIGASVRRWCATDSAETAVDHTSDDPPSDAHDQEPEGGQTA